MRFNSLTLSLLAIIPFAFAQGLTGLPACAVSHPSKAPRPPKTTYVSVLTKLTPTANLRPQLHRSLRVSRHQCDLHLRSPNLHLELRFLCRDILQRN
jgi:hypothetical protein